MPRISITGIVIQTTNWCITPATDGSFSTSLIRNDLLAPVGTFWRVDFLWNGLQQSSATYIVNHTPFNLDTETPLSQSVPAGPNQIAIQCTPFLQATPATTWTITHNENDQNVFVQASDLTGALIFPDTVNISNPNVATLTFVVAQSGRALVCHGGSINIATNQPNAVIQNPTGPQTIGNQPTTFQGVINSQNSLNVLNVISSTANPAAAGVIRFANVDSFNWRNAANGADLALSVRNSITGNVPVNTLVWDGAGGAPFYAGGFIVNGTDANVAASGQFRLHAIDTITWRNATNAGDVSLSVRSASGNVPANTLSWDGAGGSPFYAGAFIANGADSTVAIAGQLRLHSIDTINWRNNANGADVTLSKDTSDNLIFPNGLKLGGAAALSSTAQSGTGSLCMTASCALTTPTIGGASTINQIYISPALSLNSAFTSITAGTCQEQTLTLTGAATTGVASVSPTATIGANFNWSARVSATNTIAVRVCAGSTATPTSVSWNASVIQ